MDLQVIDLMDVPSASTKPLSVAQVEEEVEVEAASEVVEVTILEAEEAIVEEVDIVCVCAA